LTLLRDVGVQRDKSMTWHRHTLNAQHRSIGARALDVVCSECTGRVDADTHGGFDVAVPVLAAFGVEPYEALERGPDIRHVLGEVQQAQEGTVPRNDAQVCVDECEALIDQVQARLQRSVADRLGAVSRLCRCGHVVSCQLFTAGLLKF
jgi:hypothetical protein